jgi:eukaryotic-like serine/threonine-protein kinase
VEGKTRVTKEVLCEESRFILANVMAEARYGRQNRFEDIRRVCEGAVSIPFGEYINFLESAGYLRHDRQNETLEVTEAGETIVNGGNLGELTVQAVQHFKSARSRRKGGSGPLPIERSIDRADRALDPRPERPLEVRPPGRVTGGEVSSSSEMLDSRYEKLGSIGSGGIGHVYRARQVPLNREVALKEVRELFGFFSEDQRNEICRRFTDVVRAGASLAHPNILPIHDVNLEREYPYVVGELAPNGSVRRLITDAESIPVGLVVKYLLQTLHALRAAHKARVIHRGLKPENMLIDAYGNLKVSDFGSARIVERDSSVIRQVYVGMGAVAYMAPELFVDPVGAGPQADIYALGIIFYEMLTRKLPGRRSPMPSQIDPNLPKGIDDIFDNMTRDSRTERYSNVDDILDDFDKLKGLGEILDQQTQVLVAENPLKNIKFKDGAEPITSPAPLEEADDVLSSAMGDDEKRKKRPYSFQHRTKR